MKITKIIKSSILIPIDVKNQTICFVKDPSEYYKFCLKFKNFLNFNCLILPLNDFINTILHIIIKCKQQQTTKLPGWEVIFGPADFDWDSDRICNQI